MADDEFGRIERLRLVAAQYPRMQGLRLALLGSYYALASGVAVALELSGSRNVSPWIVGLGGLLMLPGIRRLDRYYQSTFGRIHSLRSDGRLLGAVFAMSVSLVILDETFGVPPLALLFALWGLCELWWAVRDWPYRTHRGLFGITLAIASAVQWTYPGHEAILWGMMIAGCGAVPAGLLDHRLLVEVLGAGQPRCAAGREHP
jgi:hypothetical protein